MFHSSDFKAARLLSNPHLQTMIAKWLNRSAKVTTFDETLELPDGDFVDLAWTEVPEINNTKPIIVLLHGLHGSQQSHYIKSMFNALKQQGWIAVLIHFRGCSGRPNRLAHSYHSGYIDDITYFTEHLQKRYSQCKFAIIGYSLGGNVLAKYLAEIKNSPYVCATIICAPLHLASCSKKINNGSSKIYQKYLMDLLKHTTEEKINAGLITHISLNELKQLKTMHDFDDKITAQLNGFSNAEHYYQESSGVYVLPKITKPCLILHAKDDPFLSHNVIISEIMKVQHLPNNIRFEISDHGGHVGFLSGQKLFKPQYWLDTRIPQFLQDFL